MSLKGNSSNDVDMQEETGEQEKETKRDPILQMDVFDDKDYDIEEIKFWNFISKNKGCGKSNIVRTIVYKVPETSYVVKQFPIHVESEKTKTQIVSLAKIESSSGNIVKKTNEIIANNLNSFPSSNQNIKKPPGRPSRVQNNANNQIKPAPIIDTKPSINNANITNKFNSEDIILIDEDDDIIDYNEEENFEMKNDKIKNQVNPNNNNNNNNNNNDNIKETDTKENDDDSEEENDYYIHENEDEENDDADEEDENEDEYENDEDYAYGQNKKRSLSNKNHNSRIKKTYSNKPKVVIEKVDEPVSTIKIQPPRQTRSRNKSIQLNKSNSSLINTSKINKNELNEIQSSNEKLRMTRSKSKLIDNKS
jgi:hypothetical protein